MGKHKNVILTWEQLEAWGAVDTTPRTLGPDDKILVRCSECKTVESAQSLVNLYNLRGRGRTSWRCWDCGVKSGAQKRSVGPGIPGTSRKKAAFRAAEDLKKWCLVDQTPRIIRNSEKVAVACQKCGEVHEAILHNVIYCTARHPSDGWICQKCSYVYISASAKSRIGDKNGFYGHTHSEETKQLISQSKIDQWGQLSNEEKLRLANEMVKRMAEGTKAKYGVDNVMSVPSVAQKQKENSAKFWSDGARVFEMEEKKRLTNLERYGGENPMQNPECRRKCLAKRGMTSPEKFVFEMLLMRGLDFQYNHTINGKCWDFVIFDKGAPVLIVEVDGEFHHSLTNDTFFRCQSGEKDPERFSLVPDGCKYLEVDSKKVKQAPAAIMAALGVDYDAWIGDLYRECLSSPFPYPEYSDERMRIDWSNLCRAFTDEFRPMVMPGNSVVTQFHKSIYHCHVAGQISPYDAWYTPELLLECIENRFVYRSVLSTQQIARGFERNKLAPRVTVFQPSLARYLIAHYAPGARTVVDPFSGFSGRMLGAASLDLSYTGYDINERTVGESREIIEFLGLANCSVSVADFETNVDGAEYDVLLTCPPYGQKEQWREGQNCREAEYYVTECLRKFKAKVYIFVVDKAPKYKENIAQHLGRRSHMSETSKEMVLVFRPSPLP